MSAANVPRKVTSVLVDEDVDSVTVTWGLGDPVEAQRVEYFGYGLLYYDLMGNGGKRFGVRFSASASAWVFDNESATQANYEADAIAVTPDAVVVRYNDASLGLDEIGTIAVYAHVNGDDAQVDLPVALLR